MNYKHFLSNHNETRTAANLKPFYRYVFLRIPEV